MDSIGLDIQFSTGSIKWLDTIVDMKHISMYDHIKHDITDIGIQSNNRDAMSAWRLYQENNSFDDVKPSRLDIKDRESRKLANHAISWEFDIYESK